MIRIATLVLCVGGMMTTGCSSGDAANNESASVPKPAAQQQQQQQQQQAQTTTPPAPEPVKPVEDQLPKAPPRILGLEAGWELAPVANYTASQTSSEVIIKATGEHPTGGYETKLVMSPLRIWPPQWMLAVKKPTGPATQAIVPFEVTASFKASEPIKAVHVSDAAGKHVVEVDQARD